MIEDYNDKKITPIIKRPVDMVTVFLVLQIVAILFLLMLFSVSGSGLEGLFLFFVILIPALQLFGLIGLIIAIISISKKKRSISALFLIVLSLFLLSGFAIPGVALVGRQMSGQAKIEKEEDVQFQKKLEEFDKEQAEWLKYKEDLDKINRAHYEYYKKLFSEPMTFSKYSSGGLLSGRTLALFSGVNLLILDCPKCYVVQTESGKVYPYGTKQGKLYELQKSIVDPLIGKPLAVSLPSYEDFKKGYETTLDFGLGNAGFNKLEPNYVNRPIEYYFDPEILFKDNLYINVPAIIYYQGENVNEQLKTATENFESAYKP